MTVLPFALDAGDVLDPEPRAVYDAGAVFGAQDAPVVLTVAWLDEPPGVRLEDVVREDVSRMLDEPASVLIDHELVVVGDIEAARTLLLRSGPDRRPSAAEQWRLLAGGRRWTLSAMTLLADQPVWGPRLAGVAATFRPA